MLAYILAIAIGLGSLAFYLAAFFFPEVHRKSDFIWGGVGLVYALVLWICARRMTGGVLIGQTAAVSLIGWLGWQTLTLRRVTTPADGQTIISPDVAAKTKGSFLEPLTNLLKTSKAEPTPSENPESVATLVEEGEDAAEKENLVEEEVAVAEVEKTEVAEPEDSEPPAAEIPVEEDNTAEVESPVTFEELTPEFDADAVSLESETEELTPEFDAEAMADASEVESAGEEKAEDSNSDR